LLLAYQDGGAGILRPETVELMLTPEVDLEPGVQLGLVWWLHRWGDRDAFFRHDGAHMWGWTNTSRLYPELDLGVVVCTNHWNLGEGPHHPRFAEGERISDFVAARLEPQASAAAQSWPWKVGYVAGLVIGDRFLGCLSIAELPDAEIARMTEGIVTQGCPLDPDGFRAGLARVHQGDATLQGLQELLASPDLPVSAADLPLAYAELGQLTATPLLPIGGD
jgi:hypothetical protein